MFPGVLVCFLLGAATLVFAYPTPDSSIQVQRGAFTGFIDRVAHGHRKPGKYRHPEYEGYQGYRPYGAGWGGGAGAASSASASASAGASGYGGGPHGHGGSNAQAHSNAQSQSHAGNAGMGPFHGGFSGSHSSANSGASAGTFHKHQGYYDY